MRLSEQCAKLDVEHEELGKQLARIRSLTNNYTLPSDGCPTFQRTLNTLREIAEDTHRHVHKEMNVLFPCVNESIHQLEEQAITAAASSPAVP